MANIDNECKDLKVNELHTEAMKNGVDTFAAIYNHQKEMQENTYGFDFANMTIQEIKDFWMTNTFAVQDEMHEMMDALGGIKDGDGNAVWKYWKSKHDSYKDKKISDLSDGDRKELFMEWIDILHFMLNFPISIGFTPEEIFSFYFAKAAENKDRQARNY